MSAPDNDDAEQERQGGEEQFGDILHAIRIREIIPAESVKNPTDRAIQPERHVGGQARDAPDQIEAGIVSSLPLSRYGSDRTKTLADQCGGILPIQREKVLDRTYR